MPAGLQADQVRIFWQRVDLSEPVTMLYLDRVAGDSQVQLYLSYMSPSETFSIEDFFTLQQIDITENPSQMD